MYRFIISCLFLFISVVANCQFLPGVKHIEIVSDIQDSMVLLNKPDIDKINKTYFEKRKLDSLNTYLNESVDLLNNQVTIQDSIISNQEIIILNDSDIKAQLLKNIEDTTTQYEKQLKKNNLQKVG